MRGTCVAPETEQGEGVCLESMSLKASLNRLPLSSWPPNGICEILSQSLGIVQCVTNAHLRPFESLSVGICSDVWSIGRVRGTENSWLPSISFLSRNWKRLAESLFLKQCSDGQMQKDSNLLTIQWWLGNLTDNLDAFSRAYLCVQMCQIKLSGYTKPPVVFLSEEDSAPGLRYSVSYELVNGSEFLSTHLSSFFYFLFFYPTF